MYEYSQDPLALWIICVAIPFVIGFTWVAVVAWCHWREIREQLRFGR